MGGAQFAMAGHGRMGRRSINTRSKKGPFRLLLLFGGPLFVAIAIAFIYWWIQVENERYGNDINDDRSVS